MKTKVLNEVKRIVKGRYGRISKADLDWYDGLCDHFIEEALEEETFQDIVSNVVDVIEMEKAEV